MDSSQGLRRSVSPGAAPLLLRYAAGDSLAAATVARALTATYMSQIDDALLRYQVGGSLAAATFSRALAAAFNGNA